MIELAGILILGVLAQWLAWKIKTPAILPLIVIGLLVGPIATYFTADGSKLINTDHIFQGHLLFDFVSLAVGIILFEGGLSLKYKEVKELGVAIRNIILIGSIITLVGATCAVHYLMDIEWKIALLFGSLVIVTGPTVIRPILSNVRPNHKISTILKWEGVLIDPLGAFIAILLYEFIISDHGNITMHALHGFSLTVLSGGATGLGMALLISFLMKRELIPAYLRNVIILGLAIVSFAVSDLLHPESGLLAVTLLGMILSNNKSTEMKSIIHFKEDITVILISVLFIMLSSRINVSDLQHLGVESLVVFAVVVFVLRPLSIFVSTIKSNLTLKEKLFISWISPRGIVSAGVASIFTLRLTDPTANIGGLTLIEIEHANTLLPLTFLIIVGTVVIQGATAKAVAKKLGVLKNHPQGVAFVGANEVARFLAGYLHKQGVPVLLTDTDERLLKEAKFQQIPHYEGSLLIDSDLEDADLTEYGQVISVNISEEVNLLACKILAPEFGKENTYRLASTKEKEWGSNLTLSPNIVFRGRVDFVELTQIIRTEPEIKRMKFDNKEKLTSYLKDNKTKVVPLFLVDNKGNYSLYSSAHPSFEDFELVYINK
ncbi:MAG: sodium:proton antiporter [Cytophagales bacterium]|nr:sodium:proton antiporter [Cytophagales bacterium]